MSTRSLKNISISQYESFLELVGCKYVKPKSGGGHAKYIRSDLNRPIMFQTHIDPVPEFIIRNGLRSLGLTRDDFFDICEGKCVVERVEKTYNLKRK